MRRDCSNFIVLIETFCGLNWTRWWAIKWDWPVEQVSHRGPETPGRQVQDAVASSQVERAAPTPHWQATQPSDLVLSNPTKPAEEGGQLHGVIQIYNLSVRLTLLENVVINHQRVRFLIFIIKVHWEANKLLQRIRLCPHHTAFCTEFKDPIHDTSFFI